MCETTRLLRALEAARRLNTMKSTGAPRLVDDVVLGREVQQTYQIRFVCSDDGMLHGSYDVVRLPKFPYTDVLAAPFTSEIDALRAIGLQARKFAEDPVARISIKLEYIGDLRIIYEAALARSIVTSLTHDENSRRRFIEKIMRSTR